MKLNNNYLLAMLGAGLLIANSATAQWSRNAVTSQTFLTNTGDNVGIGTTTPAFKLDIQSSGIATMQFKSITDNASILLDRGASNKTSSLTYRNQGTNLWQTGIVSNDNYQIRNNVLATPAIVVLSSNSNVGIGTAAPTERLHVVGNSKVTGNFSVSNNSTFGASMGVTGNVTATGTVSGSTITSSGNINAVNFTGSGNLDVNGYVGFGSVEQLTDGGSNTIASNSSFVPLVDCSSGSLGSSTKRWNDIFACGSAHIGSTAAVAAQLSVAQTSLSGIAGTGAFQIGETTSFNLVMDNNEIQSRTNGAANTLFLNFNGGNVSVDGTNTGGKLGIGTTAPACKLQIVGGTDANLTTGGFIITGSTTSTSLSIDDNEIIARNNGAVSDLFLNNNGGNVIVNGAGTGNLLVGTSTSTASKVQVIESTNAGMVVGDFSGSQNYLTVNKPTSSNSLGVFRARDNNSTIGTFNLLSSTFQFTVNGDAQASGGTWQNSDRRIKHDITPITGAMENIMKLNPTTYYFNREQEEYKYLNLPKEKQFGLIAQELKEVFPNMVREYTNYDEDGKARPETMHSVNYTELIPVLIKGMQEQEQTIQTKTAELNDVKAKVSKLEEMVSKLDNALAQCCTTYSNEKSATGISTDGARLEQNAPNPFSQSTIIKFYIPQNFKSAQVKVYSSLGDEMKSVEVKSSGVGQVEISGSTMAAGIYQYILLIDGKTIDSKQMILTK